MSLQLVPKSVTFNYLERLNGEMALILRYFTKFGSFTFCNTMSSSKRLQRDRATPSV